MASTGDARRPSDSIVFPIEDFDRKVVDLVAEMATPERWPAFNAVRHLNRAWRIRETDLDMASFRSLTAEEEAATALMLALQRLKYAHAKDLDPRHHIHKNAVIPFIEAFRRTAAHYAAGQPDFELCVERGRKRERLAIRFEMPLPGGSDTVWVYPRPPLNATIKTGRRGESGRPEDFAVAIAHLATESNANSVFEYLRERARTRNRLLYASKGGYPNISGNPDVICSHYQHNVFRILKICLLISPHRKHQALVQQCLDAFLKILRRPEQTLDFE